MPVKKQCELYGDPLLWISKGFSYLTIRLSLVERETDAQTYAEIRLTGDLSQTEPVKIPAGLWKISLSACGKGDSLPESSMGE